MKKNVHTVSHAETTRTGKSVLKTAIRSMFLLFAVLLMMPDSAKATHFRGGGLSWQQAGGNSIRFTLNTAWRRGYFVSFFGYTVPGTTVNIGSITYGDGTSATINALVVSEDISADIINTSWTVVKTYSATGFFVVNALNSNARVCPNRVLLPTCNGTEYNLQTRVQVGSTNNSPVSSFPTVINLPIGAPAATFTIPATDPDGDPLTFRLARILRPASTTDTTRESGLSIAAPPNFTLSSSGVVTMNTIGRTVDSQYSVQVMVEDRNASTWAVKSKIPVDFLIRMVPASSPPVFTSPVTTSYTAPIGSALTFTVTATTTDVARTVTLMGVSIPVGSAMTPSLPRTGSVGGPVSSVFSWTPGSTQSGTYVITYVAQNDLGLQTFKSISITVPCALDFSSAITSPTCNGGTNGAVTNTISNFSSTGNLSYSWSGPGGFTATTKDISGVPGGSYTFSVNDAATGCVRTRGVTISEPSAISFTATATQPTCSYNTGSVTLASSGGTGTITYSGSATTGLTTGSYSYTATDANGCTATASATITNPSAISFTATAIQPTCSYNTGSVTLASSGGTGAITYTGSATTGLTTGSYSYTATDANGCTATATETITNPSAISFSATATQPVCSYNTGSVTLASSGGTGVITYSGDATTGLTTGTYNYTATDANSCTATASATITNPSPVSVTAGATVGICPGASATLTASGADTYTWATGTGLSATTGTSVTASPTTATTYTITGTTTLGCVGTGTITVSINPLPAAQLVTGGGAYCAGGSGVVIGVQNTQSGVSYQLYNGTTPVGSPLTGSGPSISFGLHTAAGTYSVVGTVTATGCSANMSNTVPVSINPIPTVTVPSNQSVCNGATQASLSFSGSVPGTSYSWTNSNPSIGLGAGGTGTVCGTVNEHGSVTLTAPVGSVFTSVNFASYGLPTGSCGSFATGTCHASNSLTVVQSLLIGNNSATILAENSVFTDPCFGTFKRLYIQATYTSTGNIPSFTGTNSSSSPISGTITVTPTANGCSGTPGTFTITVNPNPTVYTVTGGGAYCSGGTGVSIGLSNSQTGVNYQLKQGSTPIGSPVAGTGSAISFGLQTTAGTYTVVATNVTTSCSSNMSGSATVSINTAPTVSCAGNVSVNNIAGNCSAVATYSSATATGTPTPSITYSHASGSTFAVGVTTVTATATNTCGSATCSFTVTVIDNERPTISVSNVSVNNATGTCGASVTLSATPSDNCGIASGTLAHDWTGGAFPVGTTTVTWTVTDVNGNTGTATQTVTVTDNENPVISVSGVTANNDGGTCGADITLAATAADNCTGVTLTSDYGNAGDVVNFPVGTTTITWTATDAHSNSVTATQTVTISDNENPTITAPSAITVNNTTGACSATVSVGTPTTADNCGVAGYTNDHPSTTYPVGTTTVTWTVTDVHGNTATATQTVTVNDTQNPTITAPSNVTVNNTTGACSATVSLGTPTTADNCGVAGYTNNHSSTTYPVGTTTVTWTVTDVHGNTATATQTVTVIDAQNPTITAPSTLTINGWCRSVSLSDAGASLGTPTTADNCGVATVTNNAPSVFPVGSTTVTWTVTDVNGNTATATQTVTVNTATLTGSISVSPNPTVSGQAALTIFLGYGPQNVTLAASVSGGTAAYTYSWSPLSGSSSTLNVAPTTTTTYTVTITDAHSCTRTNTQRINVVNAQCCAGSSGRCEKVYVCHNGNTICIASSAVAAHLAHSGDYLGECTEGGKFGSHDDEDELMATPAIKVYPNPTDGLINVEIPLVNKTAEIAITDITGRVIESRVIADNKGEVIQFNLGNVAKGMYLIKVNAGDAPNVTKIIVR